MRVPLSLACGDYDRTAALARGDIRPKGVDLTYLTLADQDAALTRGAVRCRDS